MLNHLQLEELIAKDKLIEDFIDLKAQVTPNGFDLTVSSVYSFAGKGRLDFSNKERQLPPAEELSPRKENPGDPFGWWDLAAGTYKVKTNEAVNLPLDIIALAFSRTSLLRMGAYTQHGVWDAGFKGRGEFLLIVTNPHGLRLKQNARVAQLVFIKTEKVKKGYGGIYQGKK